MSLFDLARLHQLCLRRIARDHARLTASHPGPSDLQRRQNVGHRSRSETEAPAEPLGFVVVASLQFRSLHAGWWTGPLLRLLQYASCIAQVIRTEGRFLPLACALCQIFATCTIDVQTMSQRGNASRTEVQLPFRLVTPLAVKTTSTTVGARVLVAYSHDVVQSRPWRVSCRGQRG